MKRKIFGSLAAVVVPLVIIFLLISLNVNDIGRPKWVGQIWLGGIIYWVAAIIALITYGVLRKGAIAAGLGIGVGTGFFILALATGLQL